MDAVNEVDLHHCLDVSPCSEARHSANIHRVCLLSGASVASVALGRHLNHASISHKGVNMKRIMLFLVTNLAVMLVLGVVLNILFSVLGSTVQHFRSVGVLRRVRFWGFLYLLLDVRADGQAQLWRPGHRAALQRDRALAGEHCCPSGLVRLASRCRKWGSAGSPR